MDPRLRPLIAELGDAISESIFESQRVAELIAIIRGSGFDATVLLNATIAIKRREPEPLPESSWKNGEVECRFNAQDVRYLRAMHISVTE